MNVIISNKQNESLQQLNIDIIKSLNGEFTVDEIIATFRNFFYQRMIIDITAIKDYKKIQTLQKLSISFDMDKTIFLLEENSEQSSSMAYLSDLVSMGIYNFARNIDGVMYLYEHPNSYRDVAQYHQIETIEGKNLSNQSIERVITSSSTGVHSSPTSLQVYPKKRIIGIKNVTKQSGATTFTYMFRNQLKRYYKVIAIEVDKRDFPFLKDNKLISTTSKDIKTTLEKYENYDVILIDINNSDFAKSLCTEIIYLLEPSVLKLNKLMAINPSLLKTLKTEKVILNQSLLSQKDVLDFEYESGLKIYFNMPPLDEREKSIFILNKFLDKLGFNVNIEQETREKHKLFGWL